VNRRSYELLLDEQATLPDLTGACLLEATPEERALLTAAGLAIPDCPPAVVLGSRGGRAGRGDSQRRSARFYRRLSKLGLAARRERGSVDGGE
jgi:hypothetical protein